MLGIGDFAQLTGLSAKALRLYDEQGLLKPAAVERGRTTGATRRVSWRWRSG
ncbi:MerR family DNA-binding transcriptional regulator [Saccharopolyspora sp. NPDC003752]